MGLSNKFQRLSLLMEPDVQRMIERQLQRTTGHDAVRFDELRGVVNYQRQGALLWQPRAEKIGEWSHELALFRWYWYGFKFGEGPHRRLDVVHREGENYGLIELTTDAINVDSERDAAVLAQLAAQLARADGVLRVQQPDRVCYFALYDGKSSEPPRGEVLRDTAVSQRPDWMTSDPHEQPADGVPNFIPATVGSAKSFSVPPPSRHDSTMSLRPGASRTMPPPVAPIEVRPSEVRPSELAPAPIRDPKREIFMPLAQTALGDVAASTPGFRQALLVVRVETAQGKGRYFVQLVALNPEGNLVALDPSRGLLEAAAQMIAEDARDGNGRWSKLAARLRATERGAAVELEVS